MNTLTSRLRAGAIGLAVAAGCLAGWPAYAGDTTAKPGEGSPQADIGAVTGLAVGAVAAGPFGAVIGAAAGALLGDHIHRQAKTSAALKDDLKKSEAERTRLSENVAQLDASLAQEKAQDVQLGKTLEQTDELGLDVGFRTNDDGVAVESMSPLLKLGALAVAMPEVKVRVAGYADPRGSEAYNADLSLRRAESVAAVLGTAGVPRERIVIEAHGKSQAKSSDGDIDGYAFDRRVTVRLELQGSSEVARRD